MPSSTPSSPAPRKASPPSTASSRHNDAGSQGGIDRVVATPVCWSEEWCSSIASAGVFPSQGLAWSGVQRVRHNKPGKGGQVVSMAVVVATGITADGSREVLGLDVGDSEDEAFWRGFLLSLKQRGLAGVQLVISDQHAGLVAALDAVLPGRRASALPGPLHPQPARPRAQGPRRDGRRGVPHDLRPTRPEAVDAAVGRGPRPARRPFPKVGAADGRRQGRGPRVHRLPARRTGARSGPPTRSSGSTRRSSAAPASWGSSPTPPP